MVDSVSAASTAASASSVATKSLAQNFDTFLKLLTTQLQHQDPLKPMDSNEFTQQLVSFTGVEQQINTNKNLESLIGLSSNSQVGSSVAYIGKQVEAVSDVAPLKGGSATWNYELPRAATKVTLSVLDAKGNVVYTSPGELAAGAHGFTWNGKNASGNAMPDGDYKLNVSATDTAGAAIAATTKIKDLVTAVEFSDAGQVLVVGGRRISLADVKSVTAASTN